MTAEQLDDDTDKSPPPVKTVRVLNARGMYVYVPVDNAPHWDERRWHPRAR